MAGRAHLMQTEMLRNSLTKSSRAIQKVPSSAPAGLSFALMSG